MNKYQVACSLDSQCTHP